MKRQKLTGGQLDKILTLTARELALKRAQCKGLGYTDEELAVPSKLSLTEGGTVELLGADYRLDTCTPDGRQATLHKVSLDKPKAADVIEYDDRD